MTSWRKFKKQFKKDAARQSWGDNIILTSRSGERYSTRLTGFRPRLVAKSNGKKTAVFDALTEGMSKVLEDNAPTLGAHESGSACGELEITYTLKSSELSPEFKELFGIK